MPLENLDDLNESWRLWLIEKNAQDKPTQSAIWRKQNPGEWIKLAAYHNGTGPRPTLASLVGQEKVEIVDALIEARGVVVPPPPPPDPSTRPFTPAAPQGTLVKKTGIQELRDGDGALTEKVEVTSSTNFGFLNQRWNGSAPANQQLPPPSTGTWILRDCKAHDIAASPPRSMDGTGEVGFQIGEKTIGERLEAWNCAWMAMCTLANCAGSRFKDLNFHDGPHVDLYMEHVSEDIVFDHCSFGKGASIRDASPLNVEWTYMDAVYAARYGMGGKAGSRNCTFVNCDFFCPLSPDESHWSAYHVAGAFLDAGTYDFRFDKCYFYGPGRSVGHPQHLLDPTKPNQFINCIYDNAKGAPYTHGNLIG